MLDRPISPSRIDGFALAALALLAFMAANLFFDIQGGKADPLQQSGAASSFNITASASVSATSLDSRASTPAPQEEVETYKTGVIPPYDHYTITQGPHGFSYGAG